MASCRIHFSFILISITLFGISECVGALGLDIETHSIFITEQGCSCTAVLHFIGCRKSCSSDFQAFHERQPEKNYEKCPLASSERFCCSFFFVNGLSFCCTYVRHGALLRVCFKCLLDRLSVLVLVLGPVVAIVVIFLVKCGFYCLFFVLLLLVFCWCRLLPLSAASGVSRGVLLFVGVDFFCFFLALFLLLTMNVAAAATVVATVAVKGG